MRWVAGAGPLAVRASCVLSIAGAFGVSVASSSVSAGDNHTCALTSSAGVSCWGYNAYGQLGNGTTTDSSTPQAVTQLRNGVVQVDVGGTHSCARTVGGAVFCWGANGQGQLGDTTQDSRTTPAGVSGLGSHVQEISAGRSHTCAVKDGSLLCWGHNLNGQLGDGTVVNKPAPTSVLIAGVQVSEVSAGWYHTCARTPEAVLCWGDNNDGQLGRGTEDLATSSPTPTAVPGLAATAVSAGRDHTCAVTEDGSLVCWGGNAFGQLGDGTTVTSRVPVGLRLPNRVRAASVSAAWKHTCAVMKGGALYCWGGNASGQLGDGTTATRLVPVKIIGSGVASVTTGYAHTCARMTTGSTKCWGYNAYGQLGDGSKQNRTRPVTVTRLA